MEYNYRRLKGVMDRSFSPTKLPFHKDCSYNDFLAKCKECVWGNDDSQQEHFEYFIADGAGIALQTSFEIDSPTKATIPWTLSSYLKVTNLIYPSRARLYCVRKLVCPGIFIASTNF